MLEIGPHSESVHFAMILSEKFAKMYSELQIVSLKTSLIFFWKCMEESCLLIKVQECFPQKVCEFFLGDDSLAVEYLWLAAFLFELTHFMPLVSFFTPLRTSKNLWFSDVFRGYRRNQWHDMI